MPSTPPAASHIWQTIQRVLSERRSTHDAQALIAETTFYIFRTDTNAVLARGIDGFDAAKERANALRKQYGLKWDQVKFKAERNNQRPQRQFGVSSDGRSFTNAYGQTSRVEYSPRYNPSKGRRFRGYTDANGDFHDID